MKRRPVVFAATVAALLLAAPVAVFAMPRNVLEVRNDAQDRGLVAGAGVSDMRHIPTARNIATIEARADIARELQLVVSTWQDLEVQAGQRIGLTAHDEGMEMLFGSITETVARATFPGSRVVYEYRAADGHYWVVVTVARAAAEAVVENAAANAEAAAAANPEAAAVPVAPPAEPMGHIERGRLANDAAMERMRQAFEMHFGN